jgi:bisphosphoglycerate-dependent phosphoglycerate mutase
MAPVRTVAVIGHDNSLRGLAMLLEDLSESEVMTLEIANGELRTYSCSGNGRFDRSGIWRPSNHSISQIL